MRPPQASTMRRLMATAQSMPVLCRSLIHNSSCSSASMRLAVPHMDQAIVRILNGSVSLLFLSFAQPIEHPVSPGPHGQHHGEAEALVQGQVGVGVVEVVEFAHQAF